ncbi:MULTISPECIES: serine hydroxymethyltransferase [Acetivibrio]|uniref:Serine hydroxymethyltransferase n=1 Tax=Acetivibrio clariflavus (strain DSM 19732 / NBRC 101661 / EBR45) TaxID=720554 RepID=G8LTJ0_ACECE|nr:MULTISPECIES: serine hydroxymethyltransferase [Acetivibrio]AEV69485.1 glycine/serine hydroxymethyltransferase [Acetivibrio clariflavus DSM 19732]HOM03182.1 serine hydroxymethyltransferase [Acetivibrio sp.]
MKNRELFSQINQVIASKDSEVAELISAESYRQRSTICLIPSENYVSAEVALALASPFTNKYSEGYPHVWKEGNLIDKNGRYYQGQENANKLEKLAIQRALELFTDNPSAYHANVQAISGAPANLAVIGAFLKPGDTLMGLALDYGGHLTHGHKVSVTSHYYNAVHYTLNEEGKLDYDEIERLAEEYKPKLIISGATAYPLKIDFERFGRIAKKVGAILLADISHIAGLCVTGEHPHPFPHADVITSTTHKILRGPRAGVIVCKKEYGPQVDKALFPALQGGPHMNTIAAMAVAFKEAMSEEYKAYAKQVVKNAKVLSEKLKEYKFKLISGGTENHLILIDVVNNENGVTVKNASWFAERLELAGIVTNKNTVPGDAKPWNPSGIRMGTPAVTTLGMKEKEMEKIAELIWLTAKHAEDDSKIAEIRSEVELLVSKFTEDSNFII